MTDRVLRAVVIVLSLAGAGVAGYVVTSRWTDAGLICSTGGCETVQSSRYAELLGLPVAAFGVAGYLLVAGAAAVGSPLARAATAALALGAFAFSGYLLVVQLAVIDAVCDWCVANDAIASLLAVAALAWLLRGDGTEPLGCGSSAAGSMNSPMAGDLRCASVRTTAEEEGRR